MVKNTTEKKKFRGYKTVKVLNSVNCGVCNSLELTIKNNNGELATYSIPMRAVSTKRPSKKRTKYQLILPNKENYRLLNPDINIVYVERLINHKVSVSKGKKVIEGIVIKAMPVCKSPSGKPAPSKPTPKPVNPKPTIFRT